MRWYIYPSDFNNVLREFFDFNHINYTVVDLWTTESDPFGRHDLTSDMLEDSNSGLILSADSFNELLNWSHSHQHMIDFVNHNNHIWIWTDIDGFNVAVRNPKELISFDSKIPKDKICLFIDARPSDGHWLHQLQNIHVDLIKFNWFMKMPRVFNAQIDKTCATKDFMLTTVKKRGRSHRTVLWRELISRNGLLDKGHAIFRNYSNSYVGHVTEDITWRCGFPSMDLYLDSWMEIVPETLYRDGYYFTEKTVKPIGTKTPFLVVSTCGYLQYLKSLGFKTFDSLIDENYDQQHTVQDRTKLMVDQLEDIIKNGSESFYRSSQNILNHNYSRLAEISGNRQNHVDIVIQRALDRIKSS